MRAAMFSEYQGQIDIVDLPEPAAQSDGVVVRVEATGLCRSDWHGWMGHDPDITLPHVPGHELAGTVVEIGSNVDLWAVGDRITVPFVAGCGLCEPCRNGDEQVCADQFQPGFTAWGSFAEYVALRYADRNLVRVPEQINSATAALLGCRFATAYRGVVLQGRAASGEWVAVHGCGGVGLAALMIARACGARVIAVDPDPGARAIATSLGADVVFEGVDAARLPSAIREATGGGPHLSIDAAGHPAAVAASVESLSPRGRHVQIGLLPANHTTVPMGAIIGRELEILGSHGMQAHRYPEMLEMILDGRLKPDELVTKTITLSEIPEALPGMGDAHEPGVTVVTGLGC
ncbi:MAG: zinc-dependent alcohol dehydrogenase family protein [Acidimicrobiia bacterium]